MPNYDCIIEICKQIDDIQTLINFIIVFNLKVYEVYKHLFQIKQKMLVKEINSTVAIVNYASGGKIRILNKKYKLSEYLDGVHVC